jgi:hypothetical protein
MTKKICDVCGKEITAGDEMPATLYVSFEQTVHHAYQTSGFTLGICEVKFPDLCFKCYHEAVLAALSKYRSNQITPPDPWPMTTPIDPPPTEPRPEHECSGCDQEPTGAEPQQAA